MNVYYPETARGLVYPAAYLSLSGAFEYSLHFPLPTQEAKRLYRIANRWFFSLYFVF